MKEQKYYNMKRRLLQHEVNLSDAIEGFIKRCEVKNLSGRTIEYYQSILNRFVGFTRDKAIKEITAEDIDNFILSGDGLSPATLSGWSRGLRAFLKFCKVDIDIPEVKTPKRDIIPFTKNQINALLKQPDKKTFTGLRDYCLMLVMLDTGARVQEILNVTKQDIIGNNLRLMGKGSKERSVPVGEITGEELRDYLKAVDDLDNSEPVFVSVHNNQLTRHSLNKRLKGYAKKAGIEGVRVSPHTFRHTFAKMYLLNGGDMFSLQKMLGHETIEMVRRYVNLFTNDIEAQHRKYSPVDGIKKRRKK